MSACKSAVDRKGPSYPGHQSMPAFRFQIRQNILALSFFYKVQILIQGGKSVVVLCCLFLVSEFL